MRVGDCVYLGKRINYTNTNANANASANTNTTTNVNTNKNTIKHKQKQYVKAAPAADKSQKSIFKRNLNTKDKYKNNSNTKKKRKKLSSKFFIVFCANLGKINYKKKNAFVLSFFVVESDSTN